MTPIEIVVYLVIGAVAIYATAIEVIALWRAEYDNII